jgi:hypothetical protein
MHPKNSKKGEDEDNKIFIQAHDQDNNTSAEDKIWVLLALFIIAFPLITWKAELLPYLRGQKLLSFIDDCFPLPSVFIPDFPTSTTSVTNPDNDPTYSEHLYFQKAKSLFDKLVCHTSQYR